VLSVAVRLLFFCYRTHLVHLAQPLSSGIRNGMKGCKTTCELVHRTLVHDVWHRLSVTTDAQWLVRVVSITTGGDWLHIAQCLSGNDLVDSTHVWVDQSQERELLGRQ